MANRENMVKIMNGLVSNFVITITGSARTSSTSSSSGISTDHILGIMNSLKNKSVRDSTACNYLGIWRSFNKFFIRLDRRPPSWEERTALYCTYLIDLGNQSSTIKSYVSAIKSTLRVDGYLWCNNKILLEALVKACKLKNDHVTYRYPIRLGLLEMLMFEIQRFYDTQPYLVKLYQAVFALGYYGLMRIGELTQGDHTLKAKDIHVARNKNKILIVLHSSKTHGKDKEPQTIAITAVENYKSKRQFFCPFHSEDLHGSKRWIHQTFRTVLHF